MFQNFFRLVSGVAVCLSLAACPPSNYRLQMRSTLEPVDTSSISPKLKSRKYDKVMVMPPSGTARGEFDTKISLIEKEFIKKGITPINGAITGRVVMERQGEKGEKKDETAQQLSDVERALIMAKETGADALLQIGQFDWSTEPLTTRYFIGPRPNEDSFREVTMEEWQAYNGLKRSYRSPWFTFVGRLTDVQTGQVMASFKVEGAANWNLPSDYMAELSGEMIVSENFAYSRSYWDATGGSRTEAGEWLKPASERTIERVIAKVAENILAQ